MIKTIIIRLLSICIALAIPLQLVAETADDLKCKQCVSTGDIERGAVTKSRIGQKAVGPGQLAPDSVTRSKIRDGAVGEQALSQELLDRISALEEQLDSVPRPIQVLANGEIVGPLIQSSPHGQSPIYLVLSSTGYIYGITNGGQQVFIEEGELWTVTSRWFEADGCVGPAFVEIAGKHFADQLGETNAKEGVVFRAGVEIAPSPPAPHFYIPAGSTGVVRAFESRLDRDNCLDEAQPFELLSVPAFPNDPSITGVPNEPFTPPITLGQ